MKAVFSTSLVVFVIISLQTTSSQHAPNSAWASDSFLQDGNLPTHQQLSRSPAIGSSQGINELTNGQVLKGMGWLDGEGSISHLKTVSNINSPEECMDACASNRKSNRQGCVAFTFVETRQRCDLKSQANAQSLKEQDSHHVMSAKCTSGCGRTGEDCAEFEVKVFFQASKENSPRTETEVMKTGGSYTRNGNFGDSVWKKFGENRFIFNNAGWKIGLQDHIGQNGGGFFKGKQNLPSNEEETWTSMSSRCPFCKVTVRCKNALPSAPPHSAPRPIAPPPSAPRPITPRRTTQRPTIQRPIASSTVQCSSTEFTCVNPRKCIPVSYICDGDYDCEDNSDETNCAVPLPDNLPHKCQRIRIRKDAHRLTEVEKTQLQHAMNGIIQDGTFQEIANYHGAPYGEKCQLQYMDPKKKTGKMGCCKHRGEGASAEDFWSWHRLYMVQLEEAMEKYLKGTDLGLPYWDWTNNAEVPDVWADIYPEIKSLWSNARRRVVSDDYKNTNHIYDLTYNPSRCHNPNRNDFSIIARIWPNQANISAYALFGFIDDAMNQKNFEVFTAKADNAHAAIHNELKCSMTSPGTTAYDPTFWMHHTFLDKVLADRQSNEFYEVPHFNNDRRRILEPFGNSRVNPYELTKITNNETLDHYNNLCYCYDSLDNCAKTSNNDPFLVSKLVSKVVAYEQCVNVPRTIQLPNGTFDVINEPKCETRYDTVTTKIIEKISKLSVSVGFIVPKGFGGVSIPYKACYAKSTYDLSNCEDGKLYLFGGSKDVTSDSPVNSENYDIRTSFLFTREITSETQDDDTFNWESLQLLDFENSLPIDAPLFLVVQITNGDKDYTFAQLQQGVKKQGYGNLLDDYNGVKDYGYLFQDISKLVNK